MLVLTRKPGETIMVGQNIRITVVRANDNSVRLGIDAPDDLKILRGELEELEFHNGEDQPPGN